MGTKVFERVIKVAEEHLSFLTNDLQILGEITKTFPTASLSVPRRGMTFCLLRVNNSHLPLTIPPAARQVFKGDSSRHVLHHGLWLIDFPGAGRIAVDLEAGKGLAFLRSSVGPHLVWLTHLFLHPAYEWLRRQGKYLIHAGAVSLGSLGLLIAGPSRSGKTTLALHLVAQGFGCLADDRCFLVGEGGRFEVLGFPLPVRAYPPNVAHLSAFGFLRHMAGDFQGKREFHLEEFFPDAFRPRARLRAVILPRWQPDGCTRLESTSPRRALVELLPLTLEPIFPETARAHLDLLADVVESVPCFTLDLGRDVEQWPSIVKEIL